MPYGYISLTQLLTQLSLRLDDTANIYWTQTELTAYLQEALRTWQSFSGYWRGRMAFNTALNTPFYDLTQQANSLLSYNLTDTNMVSVMLFQLLEPQLNGSGLYQGSDMFTLADFTKALERRRNQFLLETGMVVNFLPVPAPSPPVSRVPLPDTVIDVRRCNWLSPGGTPFGMGAFGAGPFNGPFGVRTNLWRSNEWAAQAFKPSWQQQPQDPPSVYSVAASPPLTLQLIPPPLNTGSLELLAVLAGAALNPTLGVLLGVPDNFAWVVKFGALSDMLSKAGQAEDKPRADYCERRWKEGIQLARIHTSAVQAQINGVTTPINAVESLDAYSPNWQNGIAPPTVAALASWNLFAVSPPPDQGNYSVTLDVVQNAPVPVNANDQLQLGREELDALLGYAEHVAMFKVGGAEFLSTAPLYDQMVRLAGVYNERLLAQVDFYGSMSDRAIREEILRPRRIPVEQAQPQEA